MKRMQSEHVNNISNSTEPLIGTINEDRKSIWYIVVLTLAPLYLLLIIGVIIFALIMLDRYFILPTNFVLQQGIFIAILVVGLAVAIIVYALSVTYAHRKISMWRHNGQKRQATIGQLLLIIVASMMILPIILAQFIH